MNQYELAVLRVLLKSPAPLSKSKVVNGFPDDLSDFVLSAISDLQQANFIVADYESSGDETLELVKEKKKDVLALLNSEPEGTSRNTNSGSKGKGIMWVTATLVIVGAFASVYMAYAIGVNDRLASQQLVQYPPNDVTFRVVKLPEGAVGVIGESTFEKQLAASGKGRLISAGPSGDVFVEYYGAPEAVPFVLDLGGSEITGNS